MPITTQLIGKTSAIKGGLFRIKQRLQFLGFKVNHPLGEGVTRTRDGRNHVYNPAVWSEYEVTLDMAESIRDSDLHIVSNDIGGIVGKQAALSIVYAMLHGKPVVITHKPYFRPNVDPSLVNVVNRNTKHLNFQNLLKLSNSDLKPYIELVAEQKPMYKLTREERICIKRSVRDLLRELLKNTSGDVTY